MTQIQKLTFGKVRNSAVLKNNQRILHTTDRLSAFDCILPFEAPGKGEILQAISLHFFNETKHIIKNHIIGPLSKNHLLVKNAVVFPLEIVVRRFLTGSLWRLYKEGGPAAVNQAYGVYLPAALAQNCKLPALLLTPTTKAEFGHDEPALPDQCIAALKTFFSRIEPNKDSTELAILSWNTIAKKAIELFESGTCLAEKRGLTLVDSKYEMGWYEGQIILLDEIHTPDCSRYWYTRDLGAKEPRQLSKEFLREELLKSIKDPFNAGPDLAFHKKFKDQAFVANLQAQLLLRYKEMFEIFVLDKTPDEISRNHFVKWPISYAELETAEQSLRLPGIVMIVGNGGRDYSLFKTFENKPEVLRIYCAPGNRIWNSTKYAECPETEVQEIAKFAFEHQVGLVVVGPENFIAEGIADACKRYQIPVLAPDLSGATLEASKILCKQIAHDAKIPSAASEVVSFAELTERIKKTMAAGPVHNRAVSDIFTLPRVIKYDCLAAGKGVFVAKELNHLQRALESISKEMPAWEQALKNISAQTYSAQKNQPHFLLEEFIEGEEISVLALCNGTDFRFLPIARDYKRRNNGQNGPNTGGMGAVCPMPVSEYLQKQYKFTFQAILSQMAKMGTPYRGFLFAGFMIDENEKAWLIEFNCRLGDPESQVILPGLGRDFTTELWRTAQGKNFLWPEKTGQFFDHDGLVRVYLVGAAPEYPEFKVPKRKFVDTELNPLLSKDIEVIPSSIEKGNITSGGRAFGILATGQTVADARIKAYARMAKIHFEEMDKSSDFTTPHYRTDIGLEFIS